MELSGGSCGSFSKAIGMNCVQIAFYFARIRRLYLWSLIINHQQVHLLKSDLIFLVLLRVVPLLSLLHQLEYLQLQ